MKRIYIAVFLVIFTALICIIEFSYVSKCADDISKKIEISTKSYTRGNTDKAIKFALEAEEDWQDNVKKIDMLLYHDYVDDITKNIVNLKTYIEQKDTVGLQITTSEILTQIKSLKSSEFPTLDNII